MIFWIFVFFSFLCDFLWISLCGYINHLPHLDQRNNAANEGTVCETKDCRINAVADHAEHKMNHHADNSILIEDAMK